MEVLIMVRLIISVILIVFTCFPIGSLVAQTISFQGMLEVNNHPVTGEFDLTFRIYDQPQDGDPLWQELQEDVTVRQGRYFVQLGAVEALQPDLSFDVPYWLSVQVDDNAEMTRFRLSYSAYAFSAISARNGVPVGTIISSMFSPEQIQAVLGNNWDHWWRLANGQNVADTRYAAITQINTIPDLRGMFLRGLNVGRNDDRQDPEEDGERSAGDYQADIVGSHTHLMGLQPDDTEGRTLGAGPYGNPEPQFGTNEFDSPETRPRNIAVYYYIKVN